jgi:hypothetical protein
MLNVAGRSLALKLCLLVVGTVACGADLSGQPLDAETARLASQARSLSLRWLSEAQEITDDEELLEAIQDVESLLKEKALMAPPAAYAKSCDSSSSKTFVAAFVTADRQNSDIYICEQSKNTGKVFLAQVLIHEALHLRGERNECEVTRLELLVMTQAFRMPYRNAYVERCGLGEFADELALEVQSAQQEQQEARGQI